MTRVLIVTNFLSPYRVPLLAALAAQEELEIKVIFLADSEAGRDWRTERSAAPFASQVLPGIHWSFPAREFHLHLNWGLRTAIRAFGPHVIIASGYDHVTFLLALLYAKLLHKPFVFWFESSLLSSHRTRGPIAAFKRFLVRHADAHVAFGTKPKEWLQLLGAEPTRVFTGINTVNMDWYRKEYRDIRSRESFAAERAKYRPMMLLYVGRLIPLKNVRFLLEAYIRLRDPDIGMFIVGSGPDQAQLEEFCKRHGVQNVCFEGFHQQQDLPRFYAMADVLLLPSFKEVWGLVVNEALATGLYVLCSNRAGAAYDLIKEGWNGRCFDPHAVDELADLIRDAKEHMGEIRDRRDAISEHACREFSIERLTRAFVAAIHAVDSA